MENNKNTQYELNKGLAPVSYTHLDVYKRQPLIYRIPELCTIHTPKRKISLSTIMCMQRDVYKRQGTMCQIFYAIAQKKLMQKIVSCSYQQWNISLVMRMKIQWNHTTVSYTHLDVYKRQQELCSE